MKTVNDIPTRADFLNWLNSLSDDVIIDGWDIQRCVGARFYQWFFGNELVVYGVSLGNFNGLRFDAPGWLTNLIDYILLRGGFLTNELTKSNILTAYNKFNSES